MINNSLMKILAVIPARYQSTRLPGKVMLNIGGKSLIQRVFEQVSKCHFFDQVVVAVDHEIVFEHVEAFGGNPIMTSKNLLSGTDRCAEVAKLKLGFTHIVNVQGDEPFIEILALDQISRMLKDPSVKIASLMTPVKDLIELDNPNIVKVVVNKFMDAMYFSRATIPHAREIPSEERLNSIKYYKHLGLYGFQVETLSEISKLPIGSIEKIEMLEQLRWLEAGYQIRMGEIETDSFGIDTELDLLRAQALVLHGL